MNLIKKIRGIYEQGRREIKALELRDSVFDENEDAEAGCWKCDPKNWAFDWTDGEPCAKCLDNEGPQGDGEDD